MKESRASLLLSNILVYGINQVLVVLIPMMMLPIYSRLLPNIDYYGISSVASTICTLASSVATFGMFDAAVRFAFDKTENKNKYHKEVCSTASFFMFVTSIITTFLLIIFRSNISYAFYNTNKYINIVIIAAIMALFTVWNTSALIPIRVYNFKKYAIANSMCKAVVTAIATLFFLVKKNYLVAIPIGTTIALAVTWLLTFLFIQRKYINPRYINKNLCFQMLKYAAPLMITFVSYWIYQSADKIMLTHISNLKEVGIYSIGAKIGAISGVLQNAFASGWAYFAFSTMNDKDQKQLISKIFRLGSLICIFFGLAVFAFIYPVFNLLFVGEDYLQGSYICACLFTAPLFLTLMQIIGTQLLINKTTMFYSIIQIVGAASNIILNYLFIPYFGSKGAAVATLIGYFIPLICLLFSLVFKDKIIIDIKTIISLFILIATLTLGTLFCNDWILCLVIGLISLIIVSLASIKDLQLLVSMLKDYFIRSKEH